MNKKAVIFDMDGVIFDSEKEYMKQTINFFNHYGINVSHDQYLQLIGISNNKYNEIVYRWWSNKSDKKTFFNLFDCYFKATSMDFNLIKMPNVEELLIYLKDHDYQVALASSSPINLINHALKQAGLIDYFDLLVSGDEFVESKPNPEIYLYCLKRLNININEALIIEDSTYGIQAANNAGVEVMALKSEYSDQSDAKIIINNLINIIDYL